MTLRIVGFNLSHDSSACVLEDGHIRTALALERTTGTKRGVVAAHAYAPAMAELTRDLLDSAALRHRDVDYWVATATESRDTDDEGRLITALGLLAPSERALALPHPAHHLAHASAAFYTSGFDEATAVVVDAYGSRIGTDRERETVFAFRTGEAPVSVHRTVRDAVRVAGQARPDGIWAPAVLSGIGELYRIVTLVLGFSESGTMYDDAGKTMGLASYGRRLSADNLFIAVSSDGLSFAGAADALVGLGVAVRQADGLRLLARPSDAPLSDFHYNLAAQIQSEFEEACLYLVRDALARTGIRSLVLSGGCFLNSTLNARIARETEADRLFIFPAAADDGNAVGAALYAHHVLAGPGGRPSTAPALSDVFLGPPRLGGVDIEALAAQWGLQARRHVGTRALAAAAAMAIARGEIIGWFQGRAEFGPRSLGARSILCHPGIPGMKDRLNARVKFREPFRPFAASVLAEHAAKWFDMPCTDSPFMLLVCPVLPAQQGAVAEIVHVDGTCRIQTVDAGLPGPFRALLTRFEELTGLPMVLNTSFNLRGRPIVEYPAEAIDALYGCRLDRVFIGEFEIDGPNLASLQPERIGDDVRPTMPDERQSILGHTTGQRTLREIAAEVGIEVEVAIMHALELRRHGLVRWARLPELPQRCLPLPQYVPQDTAE